ncbi:MAG: hypothetical protein ABWX71_03780 [Aeromicrobium sp.]
MASDPPRPEEQIMALELMCPCGENITALEQPAFVAAVTAHLASAHEGRSYPADMIMAMAKTVPDSRVTG